MKKYLFALLTLCAAFYSAQASPVSVSTAEQTAKAFFGAGSVTPVRTEEQTKSSEQASSTYYAFNNPSGGWVIIAGDDCCEPILAYSPTGEFYSSDLPANFKAWMSGISKNVNAARKAKLSPSEAIKSKWASVGATKAATSRKLLETASWGQDSPFNDKCPEYRGETCITGCVATAMAIVLRHNKYPAKGNGTIPAYRTSTNRISVREITLGETYNWDNMPLVYNLGANSAQKAAVATLMLHCGAMVQMDYTTESSGAYSYDIIPALVKYMGYSKSARELYRFNYSNTEWFKIIKGEIDADRAILYSGSDADSGHGHQFVVDGYDSDNMVHVNWGWTGKNNAWYAVNYLGDKSFSGVDDVLSHNDSAIIGLTPENGPSTQSVELYLESQSQDKLYGIALNSGKIAKGSTFSLNLGYVCNIDFYNAYSGGIKFGLYDRNGNLKEYVSDETPLELDKASLISGYIKPSYTYFENLSCHITGDIALGDYLMAVYKLTDGSWATLGGYCSDEFTASSNECHTVHRLSASDISYLNVPDTVSAGQIIYFDFVYHSLPSSVVWYWDNVENTSRNVKATSGDHSLKAVITYTDGSHESIQKVIKVK